MATIKQLFPQLSPKHRLWLGRSIASSFKTIRGFSAPVVDEDGLKVNSYPDDFKDKIMKIFKRFCKKVDITKKKRKRIDKFQKVQPKRSGNGNFKRS